MNNFYDIQKSARIPELVENLFKSTPRIEHERAVLLTESYKKTEGEPIVMRRAKAFKNILDKMPITIRPLELVVGAGTVNSRSSQVFPEFSYAWVESEFDTISSRSADPFLISDETKATLKEVYKYWQGRTTSELALSLMSDEAKAAMEHNIFTPGNYLYNGVGHITVNYGLVLTEGFESIIARAEKELAKLNQGDVDYQNRAAFLRAAIISCQAACDFAERYSRLAKEMADKETDQKRKAELITISENCARVPRKPARNFWEACQSFWFVQLLVQTESNGHSISPGRFDQYMYPTYKSDILNGRITKEFAQELVDCVWIKLNDLSKARDDASAQGFAGYSMFQNLIVGGQTREGVDATNDLSFMCITASMHVNLPQPSLSIRVWNKSPHNLLVHAAKLTRTGIGLPAYYNDEVIIPALVNRGLTIQDARNYNVIGCVEPQCSGKTEGWHDAAFFNMCRPLELVFSNGVDNGEQVGLKTGDISEFDTYEKFEAAYKKQMEYFISLMVNADNAIDVAHAERCPLPFKSSMVEDCIGRGKPSEQGGAVYNFTGPQGFGIANVADGLWAIKKLVYDKKKYTLQEFKEAMDNNFGEPFSNFKTQQLAVRVIKELAKQGKKCSAEEVASVVASIKSNLQGAARKDTYKKLLDDINSLEKFGNDIPEIDYFAKEVAYMYTKPVETYENPRGGKYQAGLYPVSANVPLGAQTGATPDGRLDGAPIADGVSPAAGRDVKGPTASCNSVSKLDHFIASNGTLFNMKFHPSALRGDSGIESFVALVCGYFDQKGSHVQFNVVSRETLIDAQKHPEQYKSLVVRVAGYSALFTTLSRSLQDDIISRTEQAGF